MTTRDTEILALIDRLSNEIELAQKHSLDVTIRLLKIAILDLRMLAFSISDDELQSFVEAFEGSSLSKSKLIGSARQFRPSIGTQRRGFGR